MSLTPQEFRSMCMYGPCPCCGRALGSRSDWQPDGSVLLSLYCPSGCSAADAAKALDELLRD